MACLFNGPPGTGNGLLILAGNQREKTNDGAAGHSGAWRWDFWVGLRGETLDALVTELVFKGCPCRGVNCLPAVKQPLSGIGLKLKRAYDQIETLNDEVEAFLDARPYVPAVKFNPNTGELSVRMRVEKDCPLCGPSWSGRSFTISVRHLTIRYLNSLS